MYYYYILSYIRRLRQRHGRRFAAYREICTDRISYIARCSSDIDDVYLTYDNVSCLMYDL